MPVWGERFGEIVGRDALGEAVVQSHLQLLIAYLQAIQQSSSRFRLHSVFYESRYAESALEGWGRVTGKMRKSFQG
jgi:hypothetical protein